MGSNTLFNFDSPVAVDFSPMSQQDPQHQRHLRLFENTNHASSLARHEEIKTAPLFSSHVQTAIAKGIVGISPSSPNQIFPQYGLLGMRQKTIGAHEITDPVPEPHQNLIYTNTNAPWSAFICGSQGGGKSHTLSCMLENALQSNNPAGVLPNPLAGLIFHYDKFTSHTSSQLCEAAYLCSSGVPVRVLVSPSNVWAMEKIYSNLPGLPKGSPRPQVIPLYISEKQLNVTSMMTLMSVDQTKGHTPLYLEVLCQVLRDMAMESKGAPGLKYSDFKQRLTAAGFSADQSMPLKLRLQLLEAFMEEIPRPGAPSKPKKTDVWNFEKGSLTIIDLSCPFVNENDACALFSICLSLFMEGRSEGGRIIALDEAHKFLTESSAANIFTDQLISIIAQQRHLATRVVIATQEPTLSTRLLDLCNVTIVHRFNSPAWYHTLQDHLAGTSLGEKKTESRHEIFREIVSLRTGEALVFCPKAMLDTVTENPDQIFLSSTSVRELQGAYFKMQVRKRTTTDGGKSIMAVESSQVQAPALKPDLFKPKIGNPKPTTENRIPSVPKANAIVKSSPTVSAQLGTNSAVQSIPAAPSVLTSFSPLPSVSMGMAQVGNKQAAPLLSQTVPGEESSEDSIVWENDSSSSGSSTLEEQALVEPLSRQLANTNLTAAATAKTSLAPTATTSPMLDNQKPFSFKFDTAPAGALVFQCFKPTKKGKRPCRVPFKVREVPDPAAPGVTDRYQSINAGSSWYQRLSFEEIRMHELGMRVVENTYPAMNVKEFKLL